MLSDERIILMAERGSLSPQRGEELKVRGESRLFLSLEKTPRRNLSCARRTGRKQEFPSKTGIRRTPDQVGGNLIPFFRFYRSE
jgi:hypothetical protein